MKPKYISFAPSTSEFSMPGYSLFHFNIDTQHGRGASIYISDILIAAPIVLCDEFCESVWITIPLTGSNKLLIGCIYRSPTKQYVTNPTGSRYSNKPSILDFILTNEEGMIYGLSRLSPLEKSSHCSHRQFPLLHTAQKTPQNTIQLQKRRLLNNKITN